MARRPSRAYRRCCRQAGCQCEMCACRGGKQEEKCACPKTIGRDRRAPVSRGPGVGEPADAWKEKSTKNQPTSKTAAGYARDGFVF
ncbi:MAG: hypothetical protein RIM80_04855, partial [Alphaproteobacteria bacterium]